MRIQHNIMAMNAYRNYNNNTNALSKNLEKLSSGYKINRAGDDAAGLAISEKMRAQITGLDAAQKNVKDGISLVKTAEGAMQEIQDMLNRMDYLATQSANGTYDTETDRAALQKEVEQLKSEINRIADSANFNGIKLLDGSLDGQGSTTTTLTGSAVKISGNGINGKQQESAAVAGKYVAGATAPTMSGILANGGFEYTVSTADGKSYTAKFKLELETDKASDDYGKVKYMVSESGQKYTLKTAAAASAGATIDVNADFDVAVANELRKTALNDSYSIQVTNGKATLTAKNTGTSTPAVTAIDCKWTKDGAKYEAKTDIGVDTKQSPLDLGIEIKSNDITLYDGTNYDDAVFEINGKKFVLLTDKHDAGGTADATGGSLTDGNKLGMDATEGLGSDVTILVGGTAGLTKSNKNFAQNVAKIASATGLTVTDAIDETADEWGKGTTNGIDPGAGIRLSPGKTTVVTQGKALTLQIGDTADGYNQMEVNIGSMKTSALGIDALDIGSQSGAQAAIATIKSAINQVSSVRGDLGAIQNRLEHTQNNLSVMAENIQDAESTIRDTDVAAEMMSYVKNNILVQSAQAMLAQANQVPQGVLQLLG